ncbi:hypothetical protein CHM_5g1370 [Cryptosporidium hominis]
MFFKEKSVKEVPTAPASPSILPLRDANLPETVIKEVSKILYFGFGGFLTTSIISLAVLQVNTNAVCDRNLDETNGLSAIFSLSMSLVCSLMLLLPDQRDALIKAFKYNEFPSMKKISICSWASIISFILVPAVVIMHDIGGFIKISESNSCKYTAPGLYIGTSIVLSFQLLIILLLTMALFSSNLMDLISSLPSINLEKINIFIDHLAGFFSCTKSIFNRTINRSIDFIRKHCFSNCAELYSKFVTNFKNLGCLLSSITRKFTEASKNISNKLQTLLENISRLSKDTIEKTNLCGKELCVFGKEIFIKVKSAILAIKEGSAGFNLETIPLLPK